MGASVNTSEALKKREKKQVVLPSQLMKRLVSFAADAMTCAIDKPLKGTL